MRAKYMVSKQKNTIWGQSRENKRRQMLKTLEGHMMNPHMVAAAGGGRRPECRHKSCGPLIFLEFAPACIFFGAG